MSIEVSISYDYDIIFEYNNQNQLIVSEVNPAFMWLMPYFYPDFEWGFIIFLYRWPFLYNEKIWVNKPVSCFNYLKEFKVVQIFLQDDPKYWISISNEYGSI